jgi:hypothetical protein
MTHQTDVASKRRKFRHQANAAGFVGGPQKEAPKAGVRNTGPSSGSSGTAVEARTLIIALPFRFAVAKMPLRARKERNGASPVAALGTHWPGK